MVIMFIVFTAKELQEPNCGQVRRKLKTPEFCPQRRPTFRIVGGVTAFPGHHPWQVKIPCQNQCFGL